MPNLNPALIKLIIIVLFAGAGFFRWVFVKLQEQAAKKRALEELARRRDDALRTGRNLEEAGSLDPNVLRARAEAEAAARRQAQIDEFRRRQQERARQRADAQRGAVPYPTQAPQRPPPQARPERQVVRSSPARATPVAAPTPGPVTARPASRSGPRQLLTPSAQEPESTQPQVARTETKVVATQGAQAARAAIGRAHTHEQWRRAIILSTVLSPAPGLGEGGDPWSPVS